VNDPILYQEEKLIEFHKAISRRKEIPYESGVGNFTNPFFLLGEVLAFSY
jgi:hypothetical protein